MEETVPLSSVKTEEKPSLVITEWKHSQTLGKYIPVDDYLKDKSNDNLRINNFKLSHDSKFFIVSQIDGQITVYRKNDEINEEPTLEHFYQYQAQEKEFDFHKSCELSKAVRAFDIVHSDDDHIDILSSNYRNIKYDRIKVNSKFYEYDTDTDSTLFTLEEHYIPKVKSVNLKKKHKTKRRYKLAHTYEINSLISNYYNKHNFVSSDESRIMLWDVNVDKEVYNIVCLEDFENEDDKLEKISVTKLNQKDPNMLSFGTNLGNMFLSDLRVSYNLFANSLKFNDETSPFLKTVFSEKLTKVHDLDFFNENNENTMISRHYLSLNTWDKRNLKVPTNRFMLYEPIISKLSYLYGNNLMNDKFSLSLDNSGKTVLTGGYNNMFHLIDIEQRLNTQIVIDESNIKLMNKNTVRKINRKGSCFYKKDDPSISNINFNQKILHQRFSQRDNEKFIALTALNCIYCYKGKINEKK
jgi:hypothetical protein